MARFKILLFKQDGSEVAEMTVDALWRSDVVAMAKRVAKDVAADGCGYEVWRGSTKVADRPAVGEWSRPDFRAN